MRNGLNLRQKQFVAAYLTEPNATKAAIAAGYSSKRAEVTGCELVRNRKVAEAIETARGKTAEKAELNAVQIATELADIARDETASPAARVSAYREINEMLGHHAPKQIQIREQGVTLVLHMDGSQRPEPPAAPPTLPGPESATVPTPIEPDDNAQ